MVASAVLLALILDLEVRRMDHQSSLYWFVWRKCMVQRDGTGWLGIGMAIGNNGRGFQIGSITVVS